MFRTVFSRLMAVFLVILLIAMGVQGVMLFNVYKSEAIKRTQQTLMEEAHGVSELMGRVYVSQQGLSELYTSLTVITKKSQATIWVVSAIGSSEGTPILESRPESVDSSQQQPMGAMSDAEKQRYLRPILEGKEFAMVGNFLGRFTSATITVACPVYARGEIVGAVFIHTPARDMNSAYGQAWRIILLSGTMAVLLAMVMIMITARSITRPLEEINLAAKDIAKGRFNRRLKPGGLDELGQLTESFNQMADELQKQEQTRSSFVANVSHELKSPMTSIQGFAQGMVDGTIGEEEYEKYLTIILDETRRLNKLIRELLDLSHFESGSFPLNVTVFDINELIRRVVIRYLDRMEEGGIEPEIEFKQEYCYVSADSDRIEQVIVNLMDNAIKFTPPGGHIRIWTHTGQDKVMVSVSDDGGGIAQEDIPFIFDRFYKADKSHTDKRGTGLGLAIVKGILDQHGESIQVTSKPGSGTTFAFTLKAAQRPAREEPKK